MAPGEIITPARNEFVRRSPKCTKCKNHGLSVVLKGHKRSCPRRYCTCRKCLVVTARQRILSSELAVSKKQPHELQSINPNVELMEDQETIITRTPQLSCEALTSLAFQSIKQKKETACPNSPGITAKSGTIHYKGAVSVSMDLQLTQKEPCFSTNENVSNSAKNTFMPINDELMKQSQRVLKKHETGTVPDNYDQFNSHNPLPAYFGRPEPSPYQRVQNTESVFPPPPLSPYPPYRSHCTLGTPVRRMTNPFYADPHPLPVTKSVYERCMLVLVRHYPYYSFSFLQSIFSEEEGNLLNTIEKLIILENTVKPSYMDKMQFQQPLSVSHDPFDVCCRSKGPPVLVPSNSQYYSSMSSLSKVSDTIIEQLHHQRSNMKESNTQEEQLTSDLNKKSPYISPKSVASSSPPDIGIPSSIVNGNGFVSYPKERQSLPSSPYNRSQSPQNYFSQDTGETLFSEFTMSLAVSSGGNSPNLLNTSDLAKSPMSGRKIDRQHGKANIVEYKQSLTKSPLPREDTQKDGDATNTFYLDVENVCPQNMTCIKEILSSFSP